MIFWSASCWCSSKIEKSGGGWKSWKCRLWAPSHSVIFWGTSTWGTSKDHIFHLKLIFQEIFFFDIERIEQHQIKKCHFILLLKMIILPRDFLKIFNGLKAKVRVVQFWKFYHFSTHHFPKDSESAIKNVKMSILKF